MNDMDTIPLVRLGIFPRSGHAITLGDVAVIDDNIDAPDSTVAGREKVVFPTRLLISACMYCFRGSMTMILNRKEYVIRANECLFGMPGLIAGSIRHTEDCRLLVISMTQDFLGRTPSKGIETTRKWLMNRGEAVVVPFSEAISETFAGYYRNFRRLHELAEPEFRDELTMSFLHVSAVMFSSWIVGHGLDMENPALPRKKELMMRFLNDVHEFCGSERSVAFYAGRCCLSPKYFARIIAETMGKKPGDVIKENVILEAKVLLATKTFSVQQVSDRLNFPNSSFFCKYFKSATGCSPRQYQLHGETVTSGGQSMSR